jgi:hypothetical protein
MLWLDYVYAKKSAYERAFTLVYSSSFPCMLPSLPILWRDNSNNIWRGLRVMKLFSGKCCSSFSYISSPSSKCFPQFSVIEHPQSMPFPQCKRPNVITMHNSKQNDRTEGRSRNALDFYSRGGQFESWRAPSILSEIWIGFPQSLQDNATWFNPMKFKVVNL